MLQLRGCHSASPCPPDMGLVRPIVYPAFSNYSKRFGPRRFFFSPSSFSEEGEELRLQDQAGLDRWIYLIGLKETGHF